MQQLTQGANWQASTNANQGRDCNAHHQQTINKTINESMANTKQKIMSVYLDRKEHAELTVLSKSSGMRIKAFSSMLMRDGLARIKRGEVVLKQAQLEPATA